MKTILLALISLFLFPLYTQAQSTLNFPHVLAPADFATAGFAVVNPGASDATATFTLFAVDGSVLGTATQTVRARGQIAKLATDLFAPKASGWVQLTSATTGLQGFSFAGDFLTFADGAEPAPSASELVLPIVTPSSEIHVANTGSADVTVVIELLGLDGLDVDLPFPQLIKANGFFKANTAAIFPKADLTQATHMRVKCGCGANPTVAFAAVLLARDFIAAPSWSFLNARPASTTSQTLFFPHVVDGPLGNTNWKSILSVTNLSASSPIDDVAIVFTADSGTTQTVHRPIQPNGTVRETAQQMFGFSSYQSGWVSMSSASVPITGYIAYAETVGAGVTVVPGQSDAQTNLLFAHIADLPPWWTGLALLNPSGVQANVQIFAMNPDGSLVGGAANVPTARFSLNPSSKTARLLSEFIPATQNRTSDGGFIFVLSDQPLFGLELFFSRNTQILANVPAGKIQAGSYVPPPPR